MKEKLLIIGAGINQLPIIKTAKALGYHIVAVSPPGNYPGLEIADEIFYEDIFNKENILEFAKRNDIQGVISDQSDNIAPTVAYVAEKLGLPGFGYKNALYFTNKSMMRELYLELGMPVAPNRRTSSYDDAVLAAEEIGYPVVIKPEDSYSSRGVLYVASVEELKEKYQESFEISRSKHVIIEKYISGSQYFSQGFVDDYKLHMFAFSDRYYFNIPGLFLPYTNAFPAKVSEEFTERMTKEMEKVVNHLRPQFGHVWAEWIYDEANDVLYMVEMAIRGAGANVTSDIIPAAYGIDTQPALVESAMGHSPVNFSTEGIVHKSAAFFCFLLPPGEVVHVSGLDEAAHIDGVIKTNLVSIEVGDIIKPAVDKSSRYGPIVVAGDSREDLERIWSQLKQTINIKIKTQYGEECAIWE